MLKRKLPPISRRDSRSRSSSSFPSGRPRVRRQAVEDEPQDAFDIIDLEIGFVHCVFEVALVRIDSRVLRAAVDGRESVEAGSEGCKASFYMLHSCTAGKPERRRQIAPHTCFMAHARGNYYAGPYCATSRRFVSSSRRRRKGTRSMTAEGACCHSARQRRRPDGGASKKGERQ